MKQLFQIFIIIIVFASFNSCSTDKEKNNEPKHKKLLGFKITFLADLGEEKYFKLEKKVENGKIETKYINDIIYVSYYLELNACGNMTGILKLKMIQLN